MNGPPLKLEPDPPPASDPPATEDRGRTLIGTWRQRAGFPTIAGAARAAEVAPPTFARFEGEHPYLELPRRMYEALGAGLLVVSPSVGSILLHDMAALGNDAFRVLFNQIEAVRERGRAEQAQALARILLGAALLVVAAPNSTMGERCAALEQAIGSR